MRARSPNRARAFEIYKEHDGNITNRTIADKLGISEKTVGGWKCKDKWNEQINGVLQKEKWSTPKRKGAQPGNKNSVGHKPSVQPGNKNAEKHGLFSRYIPQATLELMNMIENKAPADLIWDQIQIQYAAIIRAQEIMFVESKNEMIKELKKRKETDQGQEIEFEFQFAWDRQATFLNAQSRAIGELRGLIKQFNELANSDDERKLKLEQMQLNIEKTKAETKKLTEIQNDEPIEIIIKRKE